MVMDIFELLDPMGVLSFRVLERPIDATGCELKFIFGTFPGVAQEDSAV